MERPNEPDRKTVGEAFPPTRDRRKPSRDPPTGGPYFPLPIACHSERRDVLADVLEGVLEGVLADVLGGVPPALNDRQ